MRSSCRIQRHWVGSLTEKQTNDGFVAFADSIVQWLFGEVVCGIDRCSSIEKQSHDRFMACSSSNVQWPLVFAVYGIDGCFSIEKQSHDGCMAI